MHSAAAAAAAAVLVLALATCLPAQAGDVVLTGSLRAAEADLLATPVTSNWQLTLQWLVEEGSIVEAGDPIAVFDPAGVEDNLESSREQLVAKRQERSTAVSQGRLERMKLELAHKRAEVGFRKARLDADVPQDLLDNKDFRERQLELARQQNTLEEAERNLLHHDASERSKVAQLDLEVAELERRIGRQEDELERLTLKATRPGLIVYEVHPWLGRKVQVGDRLQATFPVARIPDLSTLEVEAWAGETDVSDLAPGLPVRFTLDAYPDRNFEGQVRTVAGAGDRRAAWGRASYVQVRLSLNDADATIMRPGMSVRCEVATTATGG